MLPKHYLHHCSYRKFLYLPIDLRVRLYSTNFNCPKRKGHICKYALSGEDRVVKLRPREAATTFVITKPGLNNYANSISFQVDGQHGVFLLKDGDRYIVASNDGSKDFGKSCCFAVFFGTIFLCKRVVNSHGNFWNFLTIN